MKICLISPSLVKTPPPLGGATETFTFELGLGLAELNNEVQIITRDGLSEKSRVKSNLTIQTLKIPRNALIRGLVYNSKILKNLLKQKPVHVIHTQGTAVFPSAYIASKVLKIPIIHTEHVYYPWISTPFITFEKKIKVPLELALAKFTINKADKITVANEFLKNAIEMANPNISAKFEIIPQGINSDIFNFNVDPSYIRKKYNIANDQKIISYVGRIAPEKNVMALIKAFLGLRQEYNNLTLLLVGPTARKFPTNHQTRKFSRYYKKLRDWIQKRGLIDSVIFTGAVPYKIMPNIHAGCNLIVQPSPIETFGRAIFEAAAVGVPFVCSQGGGKIPDYLPEASGIFIREMTFSQIQSAIKNILSNEAKYKNAGRTAAKIISERYNWVEIAKRYLKIYESLIKN
ncbi:MAG: glycosyltransferase family 4 protein [Candidatus Helarchaeota archaeon]|nr:glycosyltransferase family 4 protein [Candidatus Helarchaeota archaeon]